jgi:tripartite-type tricarboxylate transporter receptor subunit TctC
MGLQVAGLAIGLLATAVPNAAEPWPQRTVRLIVPVGSGSAPDVAARLYAERLAVLWGRLVIVDNRPGADGLVGVTAFAAMRDDHTLLFSPAAPMSVFPFTQEKLTYDPDRDFVPISSATETFGTIAVSKSLKVASLPDLVSLARDKPGKLNWTSGGGAFPTLFAGFTRVTGLDMVEVPYREQHVAIQDLSEGRVHVFATTLTALLPFAQSGRIALLAVTNKQRAPIAPQVPTVVEAGHPELQFEGLIGVFGWRSIPPTLRDRLSSDIRAASADPNLVDRLAMAGQLAGGSTARDFAAAIEDQRTRMEAIVRAIKKPGQ